jgi:hypothetical protein
MNYNYFLGLVPQNLKYCFVFFLELSWKSSSYFCFHTLRWNIASLHDVCLFSGEKGWFGQKISLSLRISYVFNSFAFADFAAFVSAGTLRLSRLVQMVWKSMIMYTSNQMILKPNLPSKDRLIRGNSIEITLLINLLHIPHETKLTITSHYLDVQHIHQLCYMRLSYFPIGLKKIQTFYNMWY